MPKVDVILPAYNSARYLAEALASVEAQTMTDWRIVLVDDGSTDDTQQVIAPFIQRLGSKLHLIQQENRGLPVARNTAIRNSSSELIALLDADDVWLPHRLAASVRSFDEKPEVGLSYGLITQIDVDGNLLGTFKGNLQWGQGHIAPYIYMRKVELPCPTIMFRRLALEDVGYFDETMRATEDRDLWFRIALHYETAFVAQVIAYYRVSSSSMSSDPERMLQAQTQFIHKHYGAPGCGFKARQIALGRAYKQRAEALKSRCRPWAALGSAFHGLAIWPFDLDNVKTTGSLLLHSIAHLFMDAPLKNVRPPKQQSQ